MSELCPARDHLKRVIDFRFSEPARRPKIPVARVLRSPSGRVRFKGSTNSDFCLPFFGRAPAGLKLRETN